MFNSEAREQSLQRLRDEISTYETRANEARADAVALFEQRQQTVQIVVACEHYLSELANAPRDLRTSVGDLRTEYETFSGTVAYLETRAHDAYVASGGGAATGVAAGVGVAAFAPTAAMAVATAFGTASTGTAISALGGAAATNAALAWLGGGAIVAGGSGMAGGGALLALAGPVGWAIGGASLIAAGGYASHRNFQVADEANQKAVQVREQTQTLDRGREQMRRVHTLTATHDAGVREQLRRLQADFPQDYKAFDDSAKRLLGALINNVNALAELLNRTITDDEVATPISQKYQQLGGPGNWLGDPTHEERATPDGVGRYRSYAGVPGWSAAIHWHPDFGAHETHGAIRAKWGSLNWENGFLGYPISDEKEWMDGDRCLGRIGEFENGAIGWFSDRDECVVLKRTEDGRLVAN